MKLPTQSEHDIQNQIRITISQNKLGTNSDMEFSKLGQAALQYASKGWNVIPLTENNEFPPKIKEWQHEATIDTFLFT